MLKTESYRKKKRDAFPSLQQGSTFQRGQRLREGFSTSLAKETDDVVRSQDYHARQSALQQLQASYESTLAQYDRLAEQVSSAARGYFNRTNSDNPYLNKVVSFSTGEMGYVTHQGVFKWIPSTQVLQTLEISQTPQVSLSIPWNKAYAIPKTPLPTDPPLIAGTPVKAGQQLGLAGTSVFVNEWLPEDKQATYMGCFADNPDLTFIGGSPPSTAVRIENGQFAQPSIASNTFQYIRTPTQIPNWVAYNAPALLNNSSAWGYPVPYPSGNQCISLQNASSIYQTLSLNTGVEYTLSFYACSRNCCSQNGPNGNPIEVQLYTANGNAFIATLASVTPPVNSWTLLSYTFTVPTSQSYNLYFKGTNTNGDLSTGIQNVQLTSEAVSEGTYTYEMCQSAAVQQGYRYFALQGVNTGTSTGYCAVSNSSPAIQQNGPAQSVSKSVPIWQTNTRQAGNTCILTQAGALQVVDTNGNVVYSTTSTVTPPPPADGNYTLVVQNDGNLIVYRSLESNAEEPPFIMWSSNTSGKQQSADPTKVSTNSKYGVPTMTSGQTLVAGDFIGSTSGNLALMMQTDGNLVLYTFEVNTSTSCQKMSDGHWGGGTSANASYDLGAVANPQMLGKVGYIDGNADLYTYPSNQQRYTTTYVQKSNTGSSQPSLQTVSGTTQAKCKSLCSRSDTCAGYSFDGTTCALFDDNIYANNEPMEGTTLYLRNKEPAQPLTSQLSFLDTVTFAGYVNKGDIQSTYEDGLSAEMAGKERKMRGLQRKLDQLSSQMQEWTSEFEQGTEKVVRQGIKNEQGLQSYVGSLRETHNKVEQVATANEGGLQNILKDSDILVLQKNYEYLGWSILATGTVLVSMYLLKK